MSFPKKRQGSETIHNKRKWAEKMFHASGVFWNTMFANPARVNKTPKLSIIWGKLQWNSVIPQKGARKWNNTQQTDVGRKKKSCVWCILKHHVCKPSKSQQNTKTVNNLRKASMKQCHSPKRGKEVKQYTTNGRGRKKFSCVWCFLKHHVFKPSQSQQNTKIVHNLTKSLMKQCHSPKRGKDVKQYTSNGRGR